MFAFLIIYSVYEYVLPGMYSVQCVLEGLSCVLRHQYVQYVCSVCCLACYAVYMFVCACLACYTLPGILHVNPRFTINFPRESVGIPARSHGNCRLSPCNLLVGCSCLRAARNVTSRVLVLCVTWYMILHVMSCFMRLLVRVYLCCVLHCITVCVERVTQYVCVLVLSIFAYVLHDERLVRVYCL